MKDELRTLLVSIVASIVLAVPSFVGTQEVSAASTAPLDRLAELT
jgi:hypothetical protein